MNYHRILSQIALVAGAFLLSAGVQTFAAFTAPTTAPPGADAYAPLHTGSDAQSKVGGLLLNTGGATNGLIVQLGNVGIGTVNPQYRLSVGSQNNPFQVSDSGDMIVNGGSDGLWALYYPDASRGALTINSGGFGVLSNLQVDGNVTINGTIRGATYGFGGMYTILGDEVSCGYPNPITGSCSCPSGFSVSTGNYTTATLVTYFCYK